MKVAIVMPLAEQVGGGELMLRHLIREGRGDGVSWLVIFLEEGSMVREFHELGVEARVVPSGRLRQPHRYLRTIFRIARIARVECADLLIGWMAKGQLYTGPAAAIAGVPSLWYQLGIPSRWAWMDRAATVLPARGVLTLSRAAAEAQAQCRPVRPQCLVHPGVDVGRFDPSLLSTPPEVRRRLQLPIEGPVIGFAGRLQRWKGVHVLIDAMPAVLRTHPTAHCVIVGGKHGRESGYPAYLEDRIAALGLEEHVAMVGFQSNVPDWMQAMDIAVYASHQEPFGIAIIEAMALGKPVIAAAPGGPSEIIRDGIDGVLVPFGDAGALASAISRYLSEPDLAHRVGVAARERALEFSARRFAENFISAVHDLLDQPRGLRS